MKKRPTLLWIGVLLLGWLFDFLFWKQPFGVNFAVFIWLCSIGGFLLLWQSKIRPAAGALWLIAPILFFSVMTIIRAEPMTLSLAILFTVLLAGVLANTYVGGRWLQYGLADYGLGVAHLLGSMIGRARAFQLEVKHEQLGSGGRGFDPWPIIRGILIALPIVAIFAALLASADAIFNRLLSDLLQHFDLSQFPEYIFRLIYILLIAYALAGVFLHAASQSRDEKLLGEEKPLLAPFLGFTESAIVLGSVSLLFSLFVAVQFQYFFGGQIYLGAGRLTDSEYARRGFGELSTVAFLSLLMILGLNTVTRRQSKAQRRVYSGLSVFIVALVMVILASAFQRLLLNELAHGFFRLRTYSHVFYIWLGLLMMTVVVLEILRHERLFALAALLASFGFVISLSLLNVDDFIVRQNVERALQGKFLNIPDLASLSSDSVPALVDEFLSPSLPLETHEAVGAILVCHRYLDPQGPNQSEKTWQAFTYSRWVSDKALDQIHSQLEGYHLNTLARIPRVRTPGNVVYECLNY